MSSTQHGPMIYAKKMVWSPVLTEETMKDKMGVY